MIRVSFRYLSGERSLVLLEIDFDADNQGRTAANKNLAWNAKNITKTITAVEQLFMKINDSRSQLNT